MPAHPSQRRWVLVAAVMGSSMAFLDGSTVNVALPALQASLGATVVDVQWVVNAYTLFLASLLLTGGALGDRFGRRAVFMIGTALFIAASVACGLAGTVDRLIAARAVQGVGGALLVPGSLALVNAAYPRDQRGRAIGLWAGFSAITSAAGPVLGGWLIDVASWRWIFFVNVPLALAVLAIAAWRVPAARDGRRGGRLDLTGSALVTAGLAGLVFALLESSSRGFDDPWVLAAGGAGAALLAAFVAFERHARDPMLPPSLFRSRTFVGVNVMTLLVYATLSGLLFFLPMALIQVRGYSATQAGASTLPFVLLLFAASRWSGGLRDRVGARRPLVLGPLIVAGAFALFAATRTAGGYWAGVFPAVTLLGVGMALVVAPLTTTVMASVPDALAGTASGANNAVSRVAGLLAMVAAFSVDLQGRLAASGVPSGLRAAVLEKRTDLAALTPPDGASEAAAATIRAAVDAAFLAGFRWVAASMAGLAVVASAVAAATVPVDEGRAVRPVRRPPSGRRRPDDRS
jgi:EmrB/QacA subfamily drug resistance transporter